MTADDVTFAVVALSAVFFVVDPLVNVPLFLSITTGDDLARRRQVARRAALAAWTILTVFALVGGLIFQALGVTLGAFKIAGGILLLLMAVDMMRAQPSSTRSTAVEEAEGRARDDVAIVPMAIPMLAGPGAIATVMVLMSRAAWQPVRTGAVLGAVTVTCVAAWLLMRQAAAAERFLPKTMLHALERVMGLLLAAVAVEFVFGGLRDLLPTLR